MIDKPTIARIMDATKIEEVVSEFVTLKKRGVNYIGLCPFHNDSHPSFSVSPTRGSAIALLVAKVAMRSTSSWSWSR